MDRQTERQTDRQRQRQRARERETKKDRERDRQTETERQKAIFEKAIQKKVTWRAVMTKQRIPTTQVSIWLRYSGQTQRSGC